MEGAAQAALQLEHLAALQQRHNEAALQQIAGPPPAAAPLAGAPLGAPAPFAAAPPAGVALPEPSFAALVGPSAAPPPQSAAAEYAAMSAQLHLDWARRAQAPPPARVPAGPPPAYRPAAYNLARAAVLESSWALRPGAGAGAGDRTVTSGAPPAAALPTAALPAAAGEPALFSREECLGGLKVYATLTSASSTPAQKEEAARAAASWRASNPAGYEAFFANAPRLLASYHQAQAQVAAYRQAHAAHLRAPPAAAAPSAASQAAIRAVIDALQSAGPDDDAMEPAAGMLTTPLLRHQRLALAWMSRRENGESAPFGGVLADDQGLGKTVSTIALIVCNPRRGDQRVPLPERAPAAAAEGAGGASGSGANGANGAAAPAAPSEEIDLTGEDDAAATAPREGSAPAAAPAPLPTPTSAPAHAARPPGAGGLEGGTLVVCPATVLHQWEAEVRSKVSASQRIEAYVYHGRGKGASAAALARFAVVLTTYGALAQELPEAARPAKRGGGGAGGSVVDLAAEDEAAAKGGKKRGREAGAAAGADAKGGPLFRVRWHRVVLDEAQIIKNKRTVVAHAASSLRARRRWCLSGTPVQNNIEELYSYYRFLKFAPFDDYARFREELAAPLDAAAAAGRRPDAAAWRKLHATLQCMMLRRTKASKIGGEPILRLPERNVRLVRCEGFSTPEEQELYDALAAECQARVETAAAEEGGGTSYFNMLHMLLRMRQACSHPALVRGGARRGPAPELAAERGAAKRLPAARRAALAATLANALTACVECGDAPDDPVVAACGHVFCRQCVGAGVGAGGQGAEEEELAFHCRAPGCGRILTQRDTFGAEALGAAAAGAPGASTSAAGGEWKTSTKVEALMEVLRALRRAAAGGGAAGDADGAAPAPAPPPAARSVSHARLAEALARGKGRAAVPPPPPPGPEMEKAIVFSQWTSMLDLVEGPLRRERFAFRRLDGSMTLAARQAAIRDFSTAPDVCVLLVSLKAASLGVNLVSANHVVLLDLWYNPAVEDQAIDRAHRIGQTRPVNVTRITVKGTVEDGILEIQERKTRLMAAAYGEAGGEAAGLSVKLSAADVAQLFSTIGAPRRK
jgi:SNF2 family DNA or RNA helicase